MAAGRSLGTDGHDIDYIAITGALHAMGEAGQRATVPLNLVGYYDGRALFLLAGILAAYIEAGRSGQGQVVDAAICDGTPSMMSAFHRLHEYGALIVAAQRRRLDDLIQNTPADDLIFSLSVAALIIRHKGCEICTYTFYQSPKHFRLILSKAGHRLLFYLEREIR